MFSSFVTQDRRGLGKYDCRTVGSDDYVDWLHDIENKISPFCIKISIYEAVSESLALARAEIRT